MDLVDVERFRTGNRNSRNIYAVNKDGSEEHVAVAFAEDFGPYVVEALNELLDQP